MLQVLLTQHIVLGVRNYLAAMDSLFLSLLEIATCMVNTCCFLRWCKLSAHGCTEHPEVTLIRGQLISVLGFVFSRCFCPVQCS